MSLARAVTKSLSGLAVAGLLGCAAPQTEHALSVNSAGPPFVELSEVPFFPQNENYCGPASLAMTLNWSGLDVTPNDLVPSLYTPGRDGTLAADVVAAARRRGRLAVEIHSLESLLSELAGGHPVVVMQNLALPWFPQWHFAVAIGYDLEQRQVILRSGEDRRLVVPLDAFERTWARADYWALVVLPPDTLPLAANELSWLRAIAGLERTGKNQAALTAYRAFLKQDPFNLVARMGEANALLALGDYAAAEAAYRQIAAQDPQMPQAWNNLAYALHFQGRREEAIRAAERALQASGGDQKNYANTLKDVAS